MDISAEKKLEDRPECFKNQEYLHSRSRVAIVGVCVVSFQDFLNELKESNKIPV